MVRASLIWLNYNSSGFIGIALRSIESALRLNFDDYEVVIVDNVSSDGSLERIRKFVEEKKPSSVRVKFVRNDANRGYAGGMNLGWEARDPEANYVAFLNNDLILEVKNKSSFQQTTGEYIIPNFVNSAITTSRAKEYRTDPSKAFSPLIKLMNLSSMSTASSRKEQSPRSIPVAIFIPP